MTIFNALDGGTFKGIRGGDRVTFRVYAGGGYDKPEYKTMTAKANPLLLFLNHVVVNHGGMGQVVNEENYISHKASKASK